MTAPSPADFDEAFRDAISSPFLKTVMRAGLPDLPDWLDSYSFVPLAGLEHIADLLEVGTGSTVVDLACGLGGPGLVVAERTGADLLGVDFSIVATSHATSIARNRLPERVRYLVGLGDRLPLRDRAADAVVCIDALPFLDDLAAPELLRVVRPGGRIVVTAWERDVGAGDLSVIPDIGGALDAVGLRAVLVERHDDWLDQQVVIYREAIRLVESGTTDPATRALADEGEAVLGGIGSDRRVLAVAVRP